MGSPDAAPTTFARKHWWWLAALGVVAAAFALGATPAEAGVRHVVGDQVRVAQHVTKQVSSKQAGAKQTPTKTVKKTATKTAKQATRRAVQQVRAHTSSHRAHRVAEPRRTVRAVVQLVRPTAAQPRVRSEQVRRAVPERTRQVRSAQRQVVSETARLVGRASAAVSAVGSTTERLDREIVRPMAKRVVDTLTAATPTVTRPLPTDREVPTGVLAGSVRAPQRVAFTVDPSRSSVAGPAAPATDDVRVPRPAEWSTPALTASTSALPPAVQPAGTDSVRPDLAPAGEPVTGHSAAPAASQSVCSGHGSAAVAARLDPSELTAATVGARVDTTRLPEWRLPGDPTFSPD